MDIFKKYKDVLLRRFGKNSYSKDIEEAYKEGNVVTPDDITPEVLEDTAIETKIRNFGLSDEEISKLQTLCHEVQRGDETVSPDCEIEFVEISEDLYCKLRATQQVQGDVVGFLISDTRGYANLGDEPEANFIMQEMAEKGYFKYAYTGYSQGCYPVVFRVIGHTTRDSYDHLVGMDSGGNTIEIDSDPSEGRGNIIYDIGISTF